MTWKRHRKHQSADKLWQQAWEKPEQLSPGKKQVLLDAIHERIGSSGHHRRRVLYITACAAAAVLAALVLGFAWLQGSRLPVSKWNSVVSNNDKREIELADGSVIWLAPHSALRIYPSFTDQRSVVMEKGTAFFVVAPDKVHPFSVAVNKHQVTVLGTRFTITVKDTANLLLMVKEGAVALSDEQKQVVVHGGEQVNTTHSMIGDVHVTPVIPADWWLLPKIRLFNVSLEELLNNIEAYYHVKLDTSGVKRTTRITLTWDFTQPLETNLVVLNQLTGNSIH